jgi:hypothetical protein
VQPIRFPRVAGTTRQSSSRRTSFPGRCQNWAHRHQRNQCERWASSWQSWKTGRSAQHEYATGRGKNGKGKKRGGHARA